MRILNISRPNDKAAGVIAYSIHRELRKRGHASFLLILEDTTKREQGIIGMFTNEEWNLKRTRAKFSSYASSILPRFIKDMVKSKSNLNPDYCPQSINEMKEVFSSTSILKKFPFEPDAIILYFIDGFLNAQNIFDVAQTTNAKILWFLPDMAAMTGGCHYAWDCEGYKELCGNCPAIYSNNPQDITHQNLLFKHKFLSNLDIAVLTSCVWQDRQAHASSLFKKRHITRVMDPVDEVIFQPGDKTEARRHFDLPLDKKIIFFGAQTLSERRKGMIYLIQALSILRINPEYKKLWDSVHLLIAGKNISQIKPYLEFDYSYKGMLSIDNELPRAFQAADVFVCPSIEDSGPMMINQSVMCGTPVVAFEMGVALDLVHAGKTGYRAVLKDSDDFARGIYHILTLSPAKLDQMRKNCRELGLSKVTPSAQVDIIEKILLENEHRF